MRLLTASEMKDVDERSFSEYGVPTLELMKRAGEKTAVFARGMLEEKNLSGALAVCGKGNNGGDGLACAFHLQRLGCRARAVVLCPLKDLKGDPSTVLVKARRGGLPVDEIEDPGRLKDYLKSLEGDLLLIDGLFGTGFHPPARKEWADAIEAVNGSGHAVLSIDLPSGLDGDSGRLDGAAVQADRTVTLGAPKISLFVYPAAVKAGRTVVANIGHPAALIEDEKHRNILLEARWCHEKLTPRLPETHKGTYGHLLIISGSAALPGAALLAAMGALRSGAGLVTLAVPGDLSRNVPVALPEVLPFSLPADENGVLSSEAFEVLRPLYQKMNALAVGPGLTTGGSVGLVIESLLSDCSLPQVLDADALNVLCGRGEKLSTRRGPTVLTPHPGELGRLMEKPTAEVLEDRLSAARDAASRFGCLTVLKGAGTVIAHPGGHIMVNATGNAGMAAGGMGDVLTGLIGGFLAQGFEAATAAGLGVYLHGLAGDLSADEIGPFGFTASELAGYIPEAITRILEGHEDISNF